MLLLKEYLQPYKNWGIKMNKRKLRRILRESIRSVLSENVSHPEKGQCPSIDEWQKLVSIAQSMLMGRYSGYGEPPRGFMKAWNRYSKLPPEKGGMNIPPILFDEVPNCATAIMQIGSQQSELLDSDYKIVCDNWMTDAEEMDDFSWNYDPDGY